jgi:hypothetical protein
MERLITETDTDSKYLPNDYWRDRLEPLPGDVSSEILQALTEFSRAIDAVITEVKDEWLQILTENTGEKGLFNYRIPRLDLYPIFLSLQTCNTFEEFFEKTHEVLWSVTDASLKTIRTRVQGELQERLLAHLNGLSQVVSEKLGQDRSELNDAIARARTQLQNEIYRVANWFRRPPASESSSYALTLPFEIGFAIIANLHPHISIEREEDILDSVFLKGYTRQSLVLIVNILLENAVKHSGLNTVNIEISAEITGGWVAIRCVNNMSKSILSNPREVENYNAKLVPMKKSLESESGLRLASKEGKSGFHKISRIVLSDLNGTCELDFLALPDYRFSVSLKISKDSLIA